ncbi:Tenascin [Holothuria leucospilota]|uniref:Tenascin n=1 Tax=Holothuria leucospilota TaxID=206669 RepID=A0A9Q1H710_HOLLE|nr:Tenascin [Holothuria leucospilota]
MSAPRQPDFPVWINPQGQAIHPPEEGSLERLYTQTPSLIMTRLVILGLQLQDLGRYTCVVGSVSADVHIFLGVETCSPPCTRNGRCENGTCICERGYMGDACESPDPDFLCNKICLNGGFCIMGSCHCAVGFFGERCEVLITDSFNMTVVPNVEEHPNNGSDLQVTCQVQWMDGRVTYPVWLLPSGEEIPASTSGMAEMVDMLDINEGVNCFVVW